MRTDLQLLLKLRKLAIFSCLYFVLIILALVFLIWVNNSPEYELNSSENIKFVVREKNIKAFRTGEKEYQLWKSEEFEKIDNVFLFDYDKNKSEELVVLYWRFGDYLGKRDYLKPIVGDDKLSQHINIYELKPYIHLVWGGSAMHSPIVDFHVCTDNRKFLCAEKSEYNNFPKTKESIKLKWNNWWWEEVDN